MSSDTLFSGSMPYGPFWNSVQAFIGSILLEMFLYGIYSVLSMIWVYVILQQRHKIHWIFRVLGLAMYMVASTDLGFTIWLLFEKLLKGKGPYQYTTLKYFLYVINNTLADILLLYRCYVVWNRDKRVLTGPAILFVLITVCGYVLGGLPPARLIPLSRIYISLTFALNVILTTLIASRIWWISRLAGKTFHPENSRRYVALMTLIESGCIYSVYMLLDLIFHSHPVGNLILDAGLIQIVGITPTLILVQVALGRTAHVEANSSSPIDVETSELRSNEISFRVSTAPSTPNGPFSTDPEIPMDTILGPSLINDAGCLSQKEIRVALAQGRDCDEYDQVADYYQQSQVDVVEVGREKEARH